ncbi:MAG: NfeD family protein [Planctomycetes bacterium]|nr:NfeD family protein [Planctomycetota bacterium]
MTAETVYLTCLFVGLFFALGSLLLSNIVGSDGDLGADGADGSDGPHLGPWSPPVIAIFLVGFGGVGYYTCELGYGLAVSVPVATAGGFVTGGVGAWILAKFIAISEGDSNITSRSLIGAFAEVVTSIPAQGMGEIVVAAMGSRLTGPAVSAHHEPIPAGSTVRILQIIGGTYHVERSSIPTSEALS